MTLKDDALRLAALRALRAAIDAEVTDLSRTVEDALRDLGARTLDARLPDGTVVATISTVTGKDRPYIADPGALAHYVEQTYPSEVIPTVRPAFAKALLDRVVIDGDAECVDPETGAYVPGLSVKPGVETVRLVSKPEQQEAIAAAWRSGDLPRPVPADPTPAPLH